LLKNIAPCIIHTLLIIEAPLLNIQTYLKISKIPQKDFAKMIGVTSQAVSNYIAGRRTPSLRLIQKMYEVTKRAITAKDILKNWEEKNAKH
jgi:transcriptional regulator with XRE-family HTH domain